MKKSDYKIKPRLVYYIIGIHFALILALAFSGKSILPKKPSTLVVKNIIIKPEPKKIIAKTKAPAVIKKSITKPKSPIAKKKTVPKPQKKITTSSLSPSKDLITQLEESLSKIEDSKISIPKLDNLEIPKPIKSLNIQAEIQNQETTDQKFQQQLIQALHENLKLPEYGEVKVSFTINLDGTISNLEILDQKSLKNQNYIKNALPELSFPWFNQIANKSENFIITFKNE